MRARIASVCAGVLSHDRPLLVVERAGLVEDGVADAELADVVQQRAAAQPPAARFADAEPPRQRVGDPGDALAVAARERALAVDDLAERRGDVVEVVVVERRPRRRPAPSRTPRSRPRARRACARTRRRARRARSARTSAGSNQLPLRSRASCSAASRPPSGVEDVDHLRQQRDPRVQRESPRRRVPRAGRGRSSARRGCRCRRRRRRRSGAAARCRRRACSAS